MVVSVGVLLMAAAGCGDDKGSDAEGGGGSGGDRPLSRAQLSKAVLAQGDVPSYTIREAPGTGDAGPTRTADESCRPIVDAMHPEASADGERLMRRSIIKTSEGSQTPTVEYLLALSSAKSESAAEQSVKDLKKAISDCGSGFETTPSGMTSKIRSVKANKSGLGDEGVDFSVEYRIGKKARYVVKQKRASLISISAVAASSREFVAVPSELVTGQEKKLDKVADE
ncbi:hypothetical protein AB0C93_05855 [Streptomyces sp. NPDC048518]|uniref:hypothetical protein n=1 Tax=Streptomyces sp. NPDC048518 TaxID=3155029 RepID=UPI0033DDEC42